VDLIFIGDSITHYWETTGKAVWDDYYGDRKAVNMGFRGDRTQNVLWRLDNGELKGISPKVAVILIGTNNTQAGDTPDETGVGIIAVAERVRAKLPNTKILILGIFPCGPSPSYMRTCNVNANALASLRNDGKQIFYLDIGSKFLNSDGKTLSKEIMSDYLHPTEKGYEIWAQSIERTLQNWGL
jgi:beta-glucosidase